MTPTAERNLTTAQVAARVTGHAARAGRLDRPAPREDADPEAEAALSMTPIDVLILWFTSSDKLLAELDPAAREPAVEWALELRAQLDERRVA